MNKKIILGVAAVLIVAIVVSYFMYASSEYNTYANAFKKTFNTDSFSLDTSVNASTSGATVSASGNFQLKDMNTTPQFINTIVLSGQTITQFCDGQYIYTDDGQSKNKLQMGQTPQKRQEKDNTSFSYEAYISEFVSLLDASKIKELNSLEPVAEKYVDKISMSKSGDSSSLEVTMLPQAVDELLATFLSENLSDPSLAPTVAAQSLGYRVTVSGDGYVSEIAFALELDVTAPGGSSAQIVTVDFKIKPVNPGQAASFSLPSIEGF